MSSIGGDRQDSGGGRHPRGTLGCASGSADAAPGEFRSRRGVSTRYTRAEPGPGPTGHLTLYELYSRTTMKLQEDRSANGSITHAARRDNNAHEQARFPRLPQRQQQLQLPH